MVFFLKGNSTLENSHALLKRCIGKYMDMLNKQWDKCLNLATNAFNILPSSDNSNSPYFLVFGKKPLDAELKELEELHRYTGSNCSLKRLQQLKNIWKAHTDNLRNIRLQKARKHDKYATKLLSYLVSTQVLVRNFTRKPLERKFLGGYEIVKVLSRMSYLNLMAGLSGLTYITSDPMVSQNIKILTNCQTLNFAIVISVIVS